MKIDIGIPSATVIAALLLVAAYLIALYFRPKVDRWRTTDTKRPGRFRQWLLDLFGRE